MNDNVKIWLRAMEPGDIDAIYSWENDPAVWNDSAAHQPFSRHALSQFIEENSGVDIYSCRQLRLMAEREEIIQCGHNNPMDANIPAPTPKNVLCKHYAVGCIDLFDFDPYHRRAGVGIIVDSHYRRQGNGIQMLAELEEFASHHLSLHQLHCIIATGNKASIALFEKAGYSQCGTLQQWIQSDDKWTDAYFYQKLLNR